MVEQMPVSVVALRPQDAFEFERPVEGVCVRIRLRREWVEGKKLARQPPIMCVGATLDGEPVKLEQREKQDAKGLLEESCELIHLPAARNKRVLIVTFREQTAEGAREFTRRLEL